MLKLNTSKCKVISISRNLDKSYTYDLTHNNYTISLERVDQMQDLGVLIDERLAFSHHIQDKINEAYSMLGVIKRNFKYLQLSSFILLYKNMVRSHLDYCSSVWTPYRKGDITDLERYKKGQLDYCLNSKDLNIVIDWKYEPTLHYRRLRGDMIRDI